MERLSTEPKDDDPLSTHLYEESNESTSTIDFRSNESNTPPQSTDENESVFDAVDGISPLDFFLENYWNGPRDTHYTWSNWAGFILSQVRIVLQQATRATY